MFCEECGQKNLGNNLFCSECGKKLAGLDEKVDGETNTEPHLELVEENTAPVTAFETKTLEDKNIKSPKKNKKKKYITILSIIMVLLIGISGTMILLAQKKAVQERVAQEAFLQEELEEEALKEETIAAFEMEIKAYETLFEQYILDDEQNQYQMLVKESQEIIDNKKTDEIESFLAKILEFEQGIFQKNNENLINRLEELRQGDVSRARADELKDMEDLIIETESLIKDKRFVEAGQKLDQLQSRIQVISVEHDNFNISVDQVDTSEYPKIKLYLNIKDRVTGQVPTGLGQEFFYLSEKLSNDSDYMKKEIAKVMQLNQHESLNINMVADVSGSMLGDPIESAKYVMSNFLENVQFGVGDKVELTAFSDGVYTLEEFTSNKQAIKDEIDYLQLGNRTSLYDALFAAVNKTAVQNGAKCVIAFTDGQDNNSQCSPSDVLDVASQYRIPIFIIGIGDSIDESILSNLTTSTNGFYINIKNAGDLEDIYNRIYRQQKELYLLEYEITDPNQTLEARDIKIDIQTRESGGRSGHTYKPQILMAGAGEKAGATDIDDVVGKYLNGFVRAINSNNYSYLEDYVVDNGPLYKEVYPYIQKDITEKLLSYEVVEKVFKDDETCAIVVHETYEIQNNEEPLHMRLLETPYILKKQANGTWKFYAFNGSIKILSKIKS